MERKSYCSSETRNINYKHFNQNLLNQGKCETQFLPLFPIRRVWILEMKLFENIRFDTSKLKIRVEIVFFVAIKLYLQPESALSSDEIEHVSKK